MEQPEFRVKYDANGRIVSLEHPSLWQKCKEEPLVPIGLIATISALVMGVSAFNRGDQRRSQLMMRWRVAAQASTVAFFVYYSFKNAPPSEMEYPPGMNPPGINPPNK